MNGAGAAFEAECAAGDTTSADTQLAMLEMRARALDQARQRLQNLVKAYDNARRT